MENSIAKCPHCGDTTAQQKVGKTIAKSQKFRCVACKRDYTPNAKQWKYSESDKEKAIDMIANGATGRAVGLFFGMSKSNAYRWIRESTKLGGGGWDCGSNLVDNDNL